MTKWWFSLCESFLNNASAIQETHAVVVVMVIGLVVVARLHQIWKPQFNFGSFF